MVTTENVYKNQKKLRESQELKSQRTRKRSSSKDINLVQKPIQSEVNEPQLEGEKPTDQKEKDQKTNEPKEEVHQVI